jgi:hypothetical protein
LLDHGSSHRHHRHCGFLLQGRRGHPSRVAWHFICHYPTPRALVLRGVSSVCAPRGDITRRDHAQRLQFVKLIS